MKNEGFKQILFSTYPPMADFKKRLIEAGFKHIPGITGKGNKLHSEKQLPADIVFAAVPVYKKALKATSDYPVIRTVLESTVGHFLSELNKSGLPKKERKDNYMGFIRYLLFAILKF